MQAGPKLRHVYTPAAPPCPSWCLIRLAGWLDAPLAAASHACRQRLSLARTLALMTSAQASVGALSKNVDALEAAMTAGKAANELFAITGASGSLPCFWLCFVDVAVSTV